MKKIIGISCIIIIIICFFGYFNSFSLALRLNGFNSNRQIVSIMTTGTNTRHGKNYRVVRTLDSNGNTALVYLLKSSMGIWSAEFFSAEESRNPQTGLLAIGWMDSVGFSIFDSYTPVFYTTDHRIYHGDNAARLIQFLPEHLPQNVTVSVDQSNADFILHFISITTGDSPLNHFDVYEFLRENNFVE